MDTRVRFPELDLLRFLAACAVMFFHYGFRAPMDHVWAASFPLLAPIFKYGYLGVNLFFLLSGFVILLTAYEKDAISFAIARVVRLYPAYWICLTFTAAAIILAGNLHNRITPGQFLANLSMIHSYFGVDDVSGVYWTLAIEWKFYFLIFLLLVCRQARHIGIFLGGWLLASIGLAVSGIHGAPRFFLFPEWSSYFIAGAMCFLIHREGPSLYKLSVVLLCYGLSVGYATRLFRTEEAVSAFQVSNSVLVLTLAVFYSAFLWIALRGRTSSSSNRFYMLGLMTYPLYLIHQEIGYILLRWMPKGLNQGVALVGVCLFAIGLSWVIHVGPERALARQLKTFLLGARRRLSASFSPAMARMPGFGRALSAATAPVECAPKAAAELRAEASCATKSNVGLGANGA